MHTNILSVLIKIAEFFFPQRLLIETNTDHLVILVVFIIY